MTSIAYIHAGGPKTGSTLIQSTALDNQKYLEQNCSLCIPDDLGWQLSSCFSYGERDKRAFNVLQGKTKCEALKDDEKYWEKLNLKLNESLESGKNLLLSYEGYSELAIQDLKHLKTFLSSKFDKIKFIYYVRSPLSLLLSASNQALQFGFEPGFCLDDLSVTIDKFRNSFDVESICIKKYIPFAGESPNALLEDFYGEFLGLESEALDYIITNKSRESNIALKEVAAIFSLYLVDQFKVNDISMSADNYFQSIGKPLAQVIGNKFKLTPAIYSKSRPSIDKYLNVMNSLGLSSDEVVDDHVHLADSVMDAKSEHLKRIASFIKDLACEVAEDISLNRLNNLSDKYVRQLNEISDQIS
ncbi:hypothetical protein OA093_00630 [bacterium]|nr:hypothetical protein [bacterium]